jgi:hypothetical protein
MPVQTGQFRIFPAKSALRSARKSLIGVLLILVLLFSGQHLKAQTSYNDPQLEALIVRQQKGEMLFDIAQQRRDGQLTILDAKLKPGQFSQIDYDRSSTRIADTLRTTSQRLTRRYRRRF